MAWMRTYNRTEGGRERGKWREKEKETGRSVWTCTICIDKHMYLTQCNELPMGELASCVAIEISMNIHKLLSPDGFLADAKYATNFLPHNHKYVNARVSHQYFAPYMQLWPTGNTGGNQHHKYYDISITDLHLVFHEREEP